MTVDAVPQRTDVNGVWEPVNTDVSAVPQPAGLVGSVGGGRSPGEGASGVRPAATESPVVPDVVGMLPVAAPTFPMWFNPGGQAGAGLPLGVIVRDGAWMKLGFPLALGQPVIDGRFVTYGLGPGARLVVVVVGDGAGFRPIVELDSPAAAEWFQGALASARSADDLPGAGTEIPYRVETSSGLAVQGLGEFGFEIVDDDGEVLFWSPPSVMWDAAGGETDEDRVEFAAVGDRAVEMPVRVEDTPESAVVVVSPDEGMLTAEAQTVWPVRIDPTTGARTPAEWVQIRTGGFTAAKYKWTDTAARNGESMGRCLLSWAASCNANFTARLVWEFGGLKSLMTSLAGADIVSATFSADPGGRGNCTSTRTDAHGTGDIVSTSPSWSSIPFSDLQSHITAPQGDSCSDNGVRREWNVKPKVVKAANASAANVSIGLKANNETTSAGYKTYRADARLTIVYNRAPNAPTGVKLSSPAQACKSGAARPVISTTTPTLYAAASDPDGGNVQVKFQVLRQGTTTVVWDSGYLAAKSSGSNFSVKVAASKLTSGTSYRYRAMATDGSRTSAWSTATCEFSVDTTKPASPTVTPVRTGVAAIYEEDVERGGAGLSGKFELDRGGSTDVVVFEYTFTGTASPTVHGTRTPNSAGRAIVDFDPNAAGPMTLTVVSKDAAGNQSPATTYLFDVAAPVEDAIWTFDEGTGEVAADTSGKGAAKELTISGAEWVDGPHELFGSRTGDWALEFDGVSDEAVTAPIVDTTASFVVSAFVRLDASKVGAGTFVAVSQEGVRGTGFTLAHLPSCATHDGACWSFGMRDDDAAGGNTRVISEVPVTGDEWVHLVGAHDATKKTMTLWVCEAGTPEDPRTGEPVKNTATRTATPWPANGAFAVGRGFGASGGTNWWPGHIDNVRVFSGQIVSEAKIRRMCQGAEAQDFSTGLDALDPTTTSGE